LDFGLCAIDTRATNKPEKGGKEWKRGRSNHGFIGAVSIQRAEHLHSTRRQAASRPHLAKPDQNSGPRVNPTESESIQP